MLLGPHSSVRLGIGCSGTRYNSAVVFGNAQACVTPMQGRKTKSNGAWFVQQAITKRGQIVGFVPRTWWRAAHQPAKADAAIRHSGTLDNG